MCGIAGIFDFEGKNGGVRYDAIEVMNQLQAHRGPDEDGIWVHSNSKVGFGHKRLSIIDLNEGQQPMKDSLGNVITFNGEIYNYKELRNELQGYHFQTNSDTEVILAGYAKWGEDVVNHLRGMFAFSIWNEAKQEMYCARDRFGIKPFNYSLINGSFYFSSEVKALIPFVDKVETDTDALVDYLHFQFYLDGKTPFKDVIELSPAHYMIISDAGVKVEQYWDVYYNLDWERNDEQFQNELSTLLNKSVELHLRSDVPVGSYISGGADSSLIASLALKHQDSINGFNGKFSLGELYDESEFARILAEEKEVQLHELEITSSNFIDNISKIIYHLDYPIAGPGSFPQFQISEYASKHNKVVLGGQGGDEIFGGYTRYLIAYFEQCVKGAIDDTLNNGNFVVTYESIIPNLVALKNYKPLLKKFWSTGLFEDLDDRYFHLINRGTTMKETVDWAKLGDYDPLLAFKKIFNGSNVGKESYFDKMTHFDFKTLLPALLHVEDRMSMAHGIESRVPFLDHPLIEFCATMPSNIKFQDGNLKRILLNTFKGDLPDAIVNRKNKMGFPVPLNHWLKDDLKDFVFDIFNSQKAKDRFYLAPGTLDKTMDNVQVFDRKIWGLLSLELWQQEFHDKEQEFKKKIK